MKTHVIPGRRNRQGMVLIEVIIALSIFAVVSLGLVMALNGSFGAAEDRNAADQAARGLRNQLALLHGDRLITGETDLTNDDSSGASYHLSVAPESMLDQKKQPVIGVYRATITAQWKDQDGHPEKRAISELVYQP